MSERDLTVATWYFLQGETMDTIARRLGVSRSTVSRILARARESGLVRITIDPDQRTTTALEDRITSEFGCRTYVADVRDSATQLHCLQQVADLAASVFVQGLHDGAKVGLAWGTTVGAVVDRLPPSSQYRGIEVVQLNGAANTHTFGVRYAGEILARTAEALGATTHDFPVPAFFDYADTKRALWRERSIQRILGLQAQLDVALFGVGAVRGEIPSHVYAGGYLSSADMKVLAHEGVVGDVCTVFLRADGTYSDIELNQRASGPSPRQLRRIPRRVCVVAGAAKVPGLAGALRAGVATDLVIDARTGRELLNFIRPGNDGP